PDRGTRPGMASTRRLSWRRAAQLVRLLQFLSLGTSMPLGAVGRNAPHRTRCNRQSEKKGNAHEENKDIDGGGGCDGRRALGGKRLCGYLQPAFRGRLARCEPAECVAH